MEDWKEEIRKERNFFVVQISIMDDQGKGHHVPNLLSKFFSIFFHLQDHQENYHHWMQYSA